MNKLALALTAFGLFAGVSCKSTDSGNQEMNMEVKDAAPVTLNITGMT